jgi:arylsulfatase A
MTRTLLTSLALGCAAALFASHAVVGQDAAEKPATKPATKPADKPAANEKSSTRAPNFIFIQAEATGWSSTSVDMDGEPPSHARGPELTPNLAKLASEGMRFSDFYVTAPRCTPSRASWVTGISPAKMHMTYQNEGGGNRREEGNGGSYNLMRMIPPEVEEYLPKGVKTTGDVLRDLGYGTAHFGKWHAGRADPKANGFDVSDGPNSNQGPERGVAPNPKQCTEIVDKGIAFMREQLKVGKPFFVQLSHYGFGAEEEATPASLEVARKVAPGVSGKPLGAIAGQHDMDLQLGRLRAALAEMGVADNTYIFFSADHGAQGGGGGGGGGGAARGGGRNSANPPFAGAKGSVSEGGIRVPFIAYGPGIAAGVVSNVRATGMDLLPTLSDLAGKPVGKSFEMPKEPDAQLSVEGGSLVPVLMTSGEHAGKGAVARSRDEIVIHFPHYDLNNGGPASAIYLGQYKLVRNYDAKTVKLYDIAKDRGETNDIASTMPEKVKELEEKLDAYLKAIKAGMPRVNPDAGKAPADGSTSGDSAGGTPTTPSNPDGARPGGGQRRGGQGGGGGKGGGKGRGQSGGQSGGQNEGQAGERSGTKESAAFDEEANS